MVLLSLLAVAVVARPASAATILTFDVFGIFDHAPIDQAYGDNVSAAADASGTYGTTNGIFTPNVTVAYGGGTEDPSLWTSGYGDLVNVYFNDVDADGFLTTRFTAAPGFTVTLESFDIASFLTNGQTIQGLEVLDGSNAVLFSQGVTFITGSTHLNFAPNVTASDLRLIINLAGLGGNADDIGIDNVTFSQNQVQQPPGSAPEPVTLSLFGVGLAGIALRRARSSARRS
jgi:hypothetical protein